ncbi:MAG: hypothetical protein DI535_04220 [Citrobacter freundii]|nr:MAG: hypothetical protein DI535_04220 [Citrobacter freundii]
MTRKLPAFLVAWLCYATAFSQTIKPKQVIITASLVHADSSTPRAMVFNFLNPFIRNRKSAAFDEHNKLSSSEEMISTQNMTVMYNDMFINLLVKPGDSVHLTIDGARLKEKDFRWLTISGDNARQSEQVNRWHQFFNTHFNETFRPGTVAQLLDSVKLVYNNCVATLDSYATVNHLLPEVKKWAAIDLRYTVSYWASDLLTTKDSSTGKINYNHALFADPFFDQYSPSGFASMMFPYHLGNYVFTLLKTDSNIYRLQQQLRYREAAERTLVLLKKEKKTLSRDYMLFSLLNSYLSKSPSLLDSLKDIQGLFSDKQTYRYLSKAEAVARNPVFTEKPINGMVYLNNDGSLTSIPAVEMLKYFGRSYPGRIIYLDIYATWCVPCLQEMEYVPSLKARADTSKITFINLCLQSEADNWKALVKKKDLHGENYFLPEDASKLFMGMYRVEGFPTYMLLNKNGELKTAKAPRPSEESAFLKAVNDLIGQ